MKKTLRKRSLDGELIGVIQRWMCVHFFNSVESLPAVCQTLFPFTQSFHLTLWLVTLLINRTATGNSGREEWTRQNEREREKKKRGPSSIEERKQLLGPIEAVHWMKFLLIWCNSPWQVLTCILVCMCVCVCVCVFWCLPPVGKKTW